MKPDLVIFDCDGVLVDSEPITNREMSLDLTARGLPISPEECINLFVGGTIKGVFHRAKELGATLPDDWVPYMYDRMIQALANEVEMIAGVDAVLDILDGNGIPYCVGSNGPMRKMEITLKRTGLWDRLAGRIYSAHDVGIAKPDPGLFLYAAKDQGTPPARCAVIEDSGSGARAAHAAGMQCFGFTGDTPAAKLEAEGATAFAAMSELPDLLGLDH